MACWPLGFQPLPFGWLSAERTMFPDCASQEQSPRKSTLAKYCPCRTCLARWWWQGLLPCFVSGMWGCSALRTICASVLLKSALWSGSQGYMEETLPCLQVSWLCLVSWVPIAFSAPLVPWSCQHMLDLTYFPGRFMWLRIVLWAKHWSQESDYCCSLYLPSC